MFYINNTEYVGLKLGSYKFELLNFNWEKGEVTIADAQLTALTFGVYSENVDAEFLVGSIGATLKIEDGKIIIGISYGIGIKISIKLW